MEKGWFRTIDNKFRGGSSKGTKLS